MRACYPIPREHHRFLVPHFFPISDRYAVLSTTRLEELRNVAGVRMAAAKIAEAVDLNTLVPKEPSTAPPGADVVKGSEPAQ